MHQALEPSFGDAAKLERRFVLKILMSVRVKLVALVRTFRPVATAQVILGSTVHEIDRIAGLSRGVRHRLRAVELVSRYRSFDVICGSFAEKIEVMGFHFSSPEKLELL